MDLSNNEQPLISVIMPVYNRPVLALRAAKSVLNQTYRNIELIIVDDASKDNTFFVLSSLEDKRLKIISHKSNMGGAQARNTGLQAATGEFIAFQDSDDEWLLDKLEKQLPYILNTEESVAGIFSSINREKHGKVERIPHTNFKRPKTGWLPELWRSNFIATPTVIIKRSVMISVGGFDAALPRYQDWDLWLRISENFDWIFVDQVVVNVYYQDNSISSNLKNAAIALQIITNKLVANGKTPNNVLATFYFKQAILRIKTKDPILARVAWNNAKQFSQGFRLINTYWFLRLKVIEWLNSGGFYSTEPR